MKGFVKAVVWIVIIAGVLVGVYMVLPEYPQNFVKSIVQPIVDSSAKMRIDQVKALKNKDFDNQTYETLLEAKAKNACWSYRLDETTGYEYVTFYGRGLTMNLKSFTEYGGLLSTSATVKIEFEIIGGSQVNIHPYVDDVLMEINDSSHMESNNKIRLEILRQLYEGGSMEE